MTQGATTAGGRRDSRAHVLAVAERLFLREGIRATGVDTVSAAAGVAKTTLYRHFPTKDDLVTAYLRRRDDVHFAWLRQATDQHPGDNPDDARAALDAVVDLVADAVTTPGFMGCPFLNAASEFADPASPARVGAAAHKAKVVDALTDLARRAGAADPETLARSLALLTDGAYEAGRVLGPSGPAAAYRGTALELVRRSAG